MCLCLVSDQMRVFIHRKCWSSTFLQNPDYMLLNADDAGRMLIGWQVGWKREVNNSRVHKKWEKHQKNQ